MNCLIHLLALCVFDPSNVYVTVGLESRIHDGDDTQRVERCYQVAWCTRPNYTGPVGTLKLGVSARLTDSLFLDYGIAHRSMVSTNRDGGQEFAFAQITWRPFR